MHTVEAWGAPLVTLTLLALGLVLGFALGYLAKRNRRRTEPVAPNAPAQPQPELEKPQPAEEATNTKAPDPKPEPDPMEPPPEPPVADVEEPPASLRLEDDEEDITVSTDREKPKPPPRREPPTLEEPASAPAAFPMDAEPKALAELRDSDRTFFILMLHEGEGISEAALSERMDLSKGAVRDALNRLEDHGLVERVQEGGRTRIQFTYEAPV